MVKRLVWLEHQYVLSAAAPTAMDEMARMGIEGSRVEEKRMALSEQVDSAAAFLFVPECQFSLAMMEWSEHLTVEAEILMAEYSMLRSAGWLVLLVGAAASRALFVPERVL